MQDLICLSRIIWRNNRFIHRFLFSDIFLAYYRFWNYYKSPYWSFILFVNLSLTPCVCSLLYIFLFPYFKIVILYSKKIKTKKLKSLICLWKYEMVCLYDIMKFAKTDKKYIAKRSSQANLLNFRHKISQVENYKPRILSSLIYFLTKISELKS